MEPTITADLDRPFMLMTAAFTRAQEPSVTRFWSHLRGWRLNVQAESAVHSSYCDKQVLMPQLGKAIGMSDEELRSWIGTLDPAGRCGSSRRTRSRSSTCICGTARGTCSTVRPRPSRR
ncbi:hypothetical protein ABZ079_27590 [Streptomyces sp. NPDC006314]|uniref:hypothetical protein n=1 Tax=Streptomyces sp. NPDC006314 TaxID=3154475 RepID=UPI0033BAB0BD